MTFHELVNYKWNKRDVPNYRFLIPVLKGSNTLNNTGVWSLIGLASLYTVPLSAVNGLNRLTTTSNGQTRPIRKFSNRPITVESNRIGTADSNSNRISKLRRSLVFSLFLNTDSDEADVTSLGRPFHTFAPATGKARPPIVDRRQVGTSSWLIVWLIEWRFYVPLDTKCVSSETLPQADVACLGMERNKIYRTQQEQALADRKKCTTTQNKHKKLKPGSVAFYDIRPGNGARLFSEEKVSIRMGQVHAWKTETVFVTVIAS